MKIVKMAGESRATGLTGGSNRLFVNNGFFYHLDSIAEDDINDVGYVEVLIICIGCNDEAEHIYCIQTTT